MYHHNNKTPLVLSHHSPSQQSNPASTHSPLSYQVRLEYLVVYRIYSALLNTAFWMELEQKLRDLEGPNPDIIMGDFNLVKNPGIDRLTNGGNSDPTGAQEALSEFTTNLNLVDGWRRRHPQEQNYKYTGQTQSKLDRIYTRGEIYPWCTDWAIEHPAVKTDH